MFTQKFIKIFYSVQEKRLFSLFRIWRSAKPRPMIYIILQSLGLDVVNIIAYAKFYQNIPNGLRVIDIFTNRPVTKSSQTVRWQNQMFDYRAHYESQPSVSVDFQFQLTFWGSCNHLISYKKIKAASFYLTDTDVSQSEDLLLFISPSFIY